MSQLLPTFEHCDTETKLSARKPLGDISDPNHNNEAVTYPNLLPWHQDKADVPAPLPYPSCQPFS
jgi:hypothetical protein